MYKYLGDTVVGGVHCQKYIVTLYIYEDCISGSQDAIQQDNPAFLTLYENLDTGYKYISPHSEVYFSTAPGEEGAITVPPNFSNDCIKNIPPVCLYRKKFEKIYNLPYNNAGYLVVYQRCCRNASIVNVNDPSGSGATYFCTIPPRGTENNSAVYRNYPPQIICLNNPLSYDHSATDADGDSLTYEFCPAIVTTSDSDKPVYVPPPPYDTAMYFPPYSYEKPMTGFPSIQIDAKTGLITGTPNQIGRYLVTVCCNEWRNGVIINTLKREFQFVVTDCSKVVVADIPMHSTEPNTYIVNCRDLNVHFENTSVGGTTYKWDFGVPEQTSDTSRQFEPNFSYPDSGTYLVKLIVNPNSSCSDSIVRFVKLYPVFRTDFVDSGYFCPNMPITFTDKSIADFKPVVGWYWNFGDGDSSNVQNPVHSFGEGGSYNVIFASNNIKGCYDTTVRKVVIQNFRPFAGDDTIIVKGEYIQFDAKGGTKYTWVPPDYLSDTSISNPVGTYLDTGYHTYYVYVESDYGCKGWDTMNVWVVNQAYFVMPNAFTPNGDGLNDIFRPRAVGYKTLKYFRIFNRWGEEVFRTTSIEQGWDGTYKGVRAEMGTYFWELVFVDRFGNEGATKGDVTLLR